MTEQHPSHRTLTTLLLALLGLFVVAPVVAETGAASTAITSAAINGAVASGDTVSASGSMEDRPSAFNLDAFNNGLPDDADSSAKTDGKHSDLWQRIKSGYAMADQQSPLAAAQESWYAARPDYVNRMVGRSQKYLYHIVEEVEKRGMPTEIALLPMVESAFNPQAYSRSRASGIWQFMPATGKTFGLKQNWWVDNRRDVMAATDAALTYLEKLHVMFGTWELALAAYNAGEGTVQRAIERNRKKGLPTDYESLQLPQETREYVPKLQAVKNIVNNPEQYGLDIQPISNQPYFTTVSTTKSMDSRLAAKLAGISLDEFKSLNPGYNRPVITANGGKTEFLLPIGNDEEFHANLAHYNKPLVSWQTYTAKRGERLDSISHKFGINISQLRDVNDLSARSRLRPGQQLLVPLRGDSANAETNVAAAVQEKPPAAANDTSVAKENPGSNKAADRIRYTVRKGETAFTIAKRYGISTKDLMAANHLQSSHLKPGAVLTIAAAKQATEIHSAAKNGKKEAATQVASAKGKTHYIVRRGETLSSIARKFNVAASDLQRWNNLDGKRIAPGHRLTIYKPDAA